ncbi:methyltransferase domain-containing protein [Deinococcus psychrotolerans]|uniref:Methyltransferase domain-containing protein n=1 Tax=Deinococcus psychrotolerans TaxID=2489213 RepID=A0A3G8Y7T5_9DEIO|nr:transcription antitermination factor NusB [Deinococcus psychrotolerans]AZI41442.1 methyltransferase domain-containing protein [Deinococcus psychrotolerans]
MTAASPNPAREVALRVLTRVLGGAYASAELDRELKRAHLAGRDSGLATQLVYGTLRHYRRLNAALTPLLQESTRDSTRAVLLAGAYEKFVLETPVHAVVNEYVDLARGGFGPPGLVNAVLRRLERLPNVSALPEWLEAELQDAYGSQARAVQESLLEPQPLWLRLTPEGVGALRGEGSEVEEGYGDVYRVSLSRPLGVTSAFKSGWAQPINPASFACVLALGEVEGVRVLDLAGGAGVKAAMLASRGAQVTSVDANEKKARPARQNMGRLHLKAEFLTADLTRTPSDLAPAQLVLLDAPCSGSGTLRAHPEIALRLTEQTVSELAELQAKLLRACAPLVAPGGTLVYSVCSISASEGPAQMQRFLADHPDFAPAPLPDLLVPVTERGAGVLTMMQGGIDGFYIARLQRR